MASKDTKRPNIVVILTDDQGYWAFGCADNGEIRTPNLDRLAATGVRFENFFCASPVCSPARASILTGRVPSQHGVHDWIRKGNLAGAHRAASWLDDDRTIRYLKGMCAYTEILAEKGYVCGLSGKWHLGDSLSPQKAFSHWFAVPAGYSLYYNAPLICNGRIYEEPRYLTDVITEDALQFFEARTKDDAPFYLSVHYTAPHSPWHHGQHPEEIVSSYGDCPFDSCPDEPVHPWQINTAPRGTGEKRRELLRGYFAAVTALDMGVGHLLDKLEAMGVRENTLIFFTSDNGMNMGHHGIWGKGNGTFPQNMYDTSVKVPTIVSRPGDIPEGVVCAHLLSHYDLMPTLLDYLGLEHPEAQKLPGKSFAPLLRGEEVEGRENVVVFDEYGPVRMIRSKEWKYVHRYPYGPHELYDLVNDPDERDNLIGDLGRKKITEQMKAQLEEWFIQYADPHVDGTREAIYGKGQIDLAGIAGKGRKAFADDWWYIDADGNPKGD